MHPPALRRIAAVLAVALGACSPDAETAQPGPARAVKAVDRFDGVDRSNCKDDGSGRWRTDKDYRPEGKGPLRLTALHCQGLEMAGLGYRYPHGDVLISPDGRSIAYASGQFSNGQLAIHVAPLTASAKWTDYPADLGSSASHFLFFERGRAAFEWSADSRFLWAATQDHNMRPKGFATGPVRLLRAEGGTTHEFAAPRHKAGPLDGVQWIGHAGKALALFGTRGSHQKPKREDRNPTIAMIDAKTSVVLDAHPISEFAQHISRFLFIEGVVMPDGRMRVVVRTTDAMTLWTQGEPLIRVPGTFRDATDAALPPDGQSVLIQYALPVRHHCDKICEGACQPPPKCWRDPPMEGMRAALYALPSGEMLWAMRARRDQPFMDPDPVPAISPDGAYALIGLPFKSYSTEPLPRMALISLADGKILQTIPASGQRFAMGFADGGRIAWIHDMGFTQIYRLD